ncbi:hypothetical protein TELCIR_03624 [Teladorsagia circumcincta]|uniref:Histone deacetylase complex subunit SAP30 Sin3 binding domain-containing protein n=1 Tax=Teladorsagia circumcincta TaxID=45464 RepID=A0A2G9UW38_TELCI|nr:hypothetical protein TELCIR_03624 [Teladorsagia circumcincta]
MSLEFGIYPQGDPTRELGNLLHPSPAAVSCAGAVVARGMSLEEFQEFRKRIRASLEQMKRDIHRYPRFNSDYSIRKQREKKKLEKPMYAEKWQIGERIEALSSSERCCLAARFPHGFVRCNRRRSGRVLTNVLERMAIAKELNLAISDEGSHKGICMFHWRLIKYGRTGVPMKKDEVKDWDACESRLEKAERDDEIESDDDAVESCVSSELNSDDGEDSEEGTEGSSFKDVLNWRSVDLKKVRAVSPNNEEVEQQQDSDEEDSNGLSTLSAASLRRYRKFFMIPTKASASKHAMLEGVENHFENLPVQSNDSIAYFIYSARNRINTVE